ncbi:hypothetical protein [Pseudolactococcus laudensis]|uniref:hypothetical protein n=2 Tax=Pseudolactococcus laudensis TaxID=1494461 RepID=UPI000277501F|nr:ABC transporter permease protein [Lactococcus raffinolactis 4877]
MTNFALIFRNLIKKDWKKLSVTLLGLVYFTIFYAPMMTNIYSTKTELLAIFETLKNPAMIALVGPTEATTQTVTLASFYFQEMTLFTALIFIIVGILHVLSRTRAEEEEGLSELVLSFPVGKLTQPVAVLLEMTGFYLTSALLITAGLTILTQKIAGFSLALSGLLFSALALARSPTLCHSQRRQKRNIQPSLRPLHRPRLHRFIQPHTVSPQPPRLGLSKQPFRWEPLALSASNTAFGRVSKPHHSEFTEPS